jgi:hypothetical protein
MRCANTECGTETLYLRSGELFAIDLLNGAGTPGESQSSQRKLIWLCDTCSGRFAVETWRPPGEQVQVRPPRSPLFAHRRPRPFALMENWS